MTETDAEAFATPLPPRANPELIGHAEAAAALLGAWRSGRMAHAWLLAGPPGIGKATLAYRFARFVLSGGGGGLFADAAESLAVDPDDPVFRRVAAGAHADLMTIERAWDEKTGRTRNVIIVDHVREINKFYHHTAAEGGWRVALIDGAEDMNLFAANALLKILEEPPDNALLLLVARSPGRLLATIRSRCRRLNLRPLDDSQVRSFLARRRPELANDEAAALARLAQGSPGRALRLADAGGLALYGEIVGLLAGTVDIDGLHAMAERVARAGAGAAFHTLMELLTQWLAGLVRLGAIGAAPTEMIKGEVVAGEGALIERLLSRVNLEQWTEVWEKIGRLATDVERVNLDRKQVVINAFNALEAISRP